MSNQKTNQKIAVIGAGPAGCMLARILHLGGLDVTVFESDAAPDFRSQGGTLDLHADMGIAAMQRAGLMAEFKKHARYDAQYLAIPDKDLHYHFKMGTETKAAGIGQRPEIDRTKLREILFQSLPVGMIRWGHHLKRLDGRTLVFEDRRSSSSSGGEGNNRETHGEEELRASGFDLIVGADGAWSKIRHAIAPELRPKYTRVAGHDLSIPNAAETAPALHKLVHNGSLFGSWEGQRLTAQQLGDGSINLYAMFVRDDPDWMAPGKCPYDAWDLDETGAALQKEFHDWHPTLRDAVLLSDKSVPRSLYILPVGARWNYRQGFTLIGDAAHLMTPYAGEGVNQALQDAMILGETILSSVEAGEDINTGIPQFEDDMMARVKDVQQLSLDLLVDWMFTPGAPKKVMPKVISRHVKHALPTVLQPVGAAGVHIYYFFKNLW